MSTPLMTAYFWDDSENGQPECWRWVGAVTRNGEKIGSFEPEGVSRTRPEAVAWAIQIAGEFGWDYTERGKR